MSATGPGIRARLHGLFDLYSANSYDFQDGGQGSGGVRQVLLVDELERLMQDAGIADGGAGGDPWVRRLFKRFASAHTMRRGPVAVEAEGLSFTEFNDCLVAVALEKYPQRSSRVGALNALLHDWLLPLLGPAGAQGHEEPQSDPADTLAPPEAAMSPGGSLGRVGSSSLLLGHSQRRELGAAPPVGPQRPLYSMPKVVRPASRGSPQERASTEAGSPPPAEDAQTPSPPPPPPPQPSPADGPVSAGAQARTVQWWDPPPVPASRLRRPPQVFTSGTTMHPPNEDWAAQVRSYYQPGPHRPRDRSALPRAEGVSGSSPAGPLRHGRSLAASSASTPSLHTAGYVQRLHAPPLDLARDPLPSSAGGVPHANDQPASTVAGRKAPFPDAVGAGQGRGRKQQRQQKRWQQRQQQRRRTLQGGSRSGHRPPSPWSQTLALESPSGSVARAPPPGRGRRRPPSAKLGAWETETSAAEHTPAVSLDAAEEALRRHALRRGDRAGTVSSTVPVDAPPRRQKPRAAAPTIPPPRAVADNDLVLGEAAMSPPPPVAPRGAAAAQSTAGTRTRTRSQHASRARPRTAAGSPRRSARTPLQATPGAGVSPAVAARPVGPVRSTSATQRSSGLRPIGTPPPSLPRPGGSSKSAAPPQRQPKAAPSPGAPALRRGPSLSASTAALSGAGRHYPPRHSHSAITLLEGSGLGGSGRGHGDPGPVLTLHASAGRMRRGRPQAVNGESYTAPQLASEVAAVALRAEGQAKRLTGTELRLEEARLEIQRTCPLSWREEGRNKRGRPMVTTSETGGSARAAPYCTQSPSRLRRTPQRTGAGRAGGLATGVPELTVDGRRGARSLLALRRLTSRHCQSFAAQRP